MKRGATHADWAVSLGIFLVYTLSLFILIQPGVEPIFRNENLIKIVDSSFFNETRLVLEKTPIIFTPIEIEVDGIYEAVIRNDIPLSGNELDLTDFYLTDDAGNQLPFDMDFSGDAVSEIRVQATLSRTEPTIIYVHYSPNAYEAPEAITATISISDKLPKLNFTRTFGSIEVMAGINSEIINIDTVNFPCTTPEEYSELKSKWNYPLNKEFQIFMVPSSNPKYELADIKDICNQVEPFQQASIFVQERVDVTLDEFGIRNPVRINMRVW